MAHRPAGGGGGGGVGGAGAAAAAAAGEPRATGLHSTTGATAKNVSRSTGAIPVLPALSSTVTVGNGASCSSVGNPACEEDPGRRGYNFNRDVCGGDGGEWPRRKQRRGNHDAGGGSSGPVKIWCCPTTASLREEACADLSGMARPGLWQSWKHGTEEREAGQHQLERLRERFKADRKVKFCLRSVVQNRYGINMIMAAGSLSIFLRCVLSSIVAMIGHEKRLASICGKLSSKTSLYQARHFGTAKPATISLDLLPNPHPLRARRRGGWPV